MLQTLTPNSEYTVEAFLHPTIPAIFEYKKFRVRTIKCANQDCAKLTFSLKAGFSIQHSQRPGSRPTETASIFNERVYPNPKGKPQPNFIPPQIIQDYQEACLISKLSPKASATLARRAVQGIIRDFAGIVKPTLHKEITELREQIIAREAPPEFTLDIVDVIDGIRSLGNIGAHMDKDVNIIVDVEPDEAELLISLVENLFDSLYVARHRREEGLKKLQSTVAAKSANKTGGAVT